MLGASDDLEIYHDGTNSYIADRGTGNLRLEGTNIALNNQASNKTYLLATDGGSVQLRHNDLTKIETTTTGIDVTGNIGVTGTVDGIDIAARDAVLTSTTTTAGAALPKAGGTMTGPITMSQSGALHNQFTSTGSFSKISIISADGEQAYINYSGATNEMSAGYDRTTSQFRISNADTLSSGIRMSINSSTGNTSIAGATQDRRLTINNSQANGLQFNFDDSNAYRIRLTPYWSSNANTRLDFDVARTSGATPSTIMSVGYNSNVGIGTTTPGRALEVSTDGTAQFRLSRVDSTINGNNTLGTIEFWGTDDTSGTIGATIVAHAASTWGGGAYPTDLRFSTMDGSTLSEQMRITRLGDISIGSDHGGFSGWKVLNIRQSSTGGMVNFEEDDGTRAFTFANQGVGMRYQAHITGGYHRFETHAMGGGTAMMITDDGKVGIGLSDPDSKLEIKGAGGALGLTFKTTDASSNETFFCMDGGRVGVRYGPLLVGIPSGTTPATSALFQVEEAGLLTVLSTGNVGIGTTGPAQKLHVVGSAIIDGGTGVASTGVLNVRQSGDTLNNGIALTSSHATSHRIWKDSTGKLNFGPTSLPSAFVQDLTGKIGIGTALPLHKLAIGGNSTQTLKSTVAITDMTNGASLSLRGQAPTIFFDSTSAGIPTILMDGRGIEFKDGTLDSQGNVDVKIDATGNVGIGTAAPIEKLDVSGYQGISVNANYAHMGSTVSGAMAIFGHNIKSDSGNNIIKSANNGYHSSMIKMYYNEGITFHATAGTQSAGADFYNISGTTNELMRLTNDGNLGIGTSSPQAKLHVDGTTIFDTATGSQPVYFTRLGNINESLKIHCDDRGAVFESIQDETADTYGNFIFAMDAGVTEPYFDVRKGSADSASIFRVDGGGNVGIGTQSPFSRLQTGGHTFSGGNGMHADARVGISNHGNLTGLMLASTYNDAAHPEYGLVFVQGPSTSSYNVWSVSPDGPAKGDSLNFHYQAQSTNIHSPSNAKVVFDGNGNIAFGGNLHFRTAQDGSFIGPLNTSDLRLAADGNHIFQTYVGGWGTRMEIRDNGIRFPAGDYGVHTTQEHYSNPSSPGSFSTATNTAYTSSTQYWPDQGEKQICVINARAFTKYIHIKTNLTANNIMFYFRTKGYFYSYGMEEQLVGGYTYYSGGNMILSKSNETVAGNTHTGDTYRASDGSLVLKMHVNHTGYTEGKMLVFFHAHAPSTTSAITVTAVTQKDDGTNAF